MRSDDRTAPNDSAAASAAEAVEHPDRIGPYRVLRVLGEGGMGVVYEAEQTEPVTRRVALKVLKLGMDTREIVARFEAERQALAVMEHPSIAKVLDAGASETGRPYFVMEHVRGVPFTEYCDMHRLSTRDRLELFLPVCQAIQHAHQKGVIHRDLKPSNVLVTEQGGDAVPKIIDFGIAKATGQRLTDKTLVTAYGQAMGTPAYMSPEQAEMSGLDVDTRTDIYSLGVMLYELLVGRLPLDPGELGMSAFIARLVMRETDPPTPSGRLAGLQRERQMLAQLRHTDPGTLTRELKGDLDWIVMKAMDPDRTRRYETANGLALELQRYLHHEPVLARPPSARYRFGKFVRRHRAGVTAAVIVAAGLVASTVLATLGMVRATRAEQATAREAEASRQVSEFLVGLFQVSDPDQARGNTITAREILDRGAAEIADGLGDQPLVRARLMATMGDVYRALGLYDEATPLLTRSLAIREEALPADHVDLAESLYRLALLYRQQGKFADAEPLYRRALAIRERAFGPSHVEVAQIVGSLGGSYLERGRYAQADTLLHRALAIREQHVGPNDPTVAVSLGNLGALYWSQGKLAEAEPFLRRSLAIRERTLGADHPALAEGLNNLGALYWTLGQYDQAETFYVRARDIWERTLGPNHRNTAAVLNNLGETYWAQKKYAEAEPLFRQALAVKEALLEPSHPSVGVTLNGLANLLRDVGRYAEAERLYRRALAIREGALGPTNPAVAETLRDLAELLRRTGRPAPAAQFQARADAITRGASADTSQ